MFSTYILKFWITKNYTWISVVFQHWYYVDGKKYVYTQNKDPYILPGQYHRCWWPGETVSLVISTHGIYHVEKKTYPCVAGGRIDRFSYVAFY